MCVSQSFAWTLFDVCIFFVLLFVKLLITFSTSMYKIYFLKIAKHIIVGCLFKNIHPPLQCSSRSLIQASLCDFFFFLIFLIFFFFLDNSFFPHITTVETVFTYPQSNEPKHSQNKVAELNIYARARACVRVCVCLNLSCMQTFGWIKCNGFFDGFQKLQAMDNGTLFS